MYLHDMLLEFTEIVVNYDKLAGTILRQQQHKKKTVNCCHQVSLAHPFIFSPATESRFIFLHSSGMRMTPLKEPSG